MAGIHAIFVGMTLSLSDTYTRVGIVASIATILTFVFLVFERMPLSLYETYTWMGIAAIAMILLVVFLVYDPYSARSRRDMERAKQAICQGAEAEFSMAMRQFGEVPTSGEQHTRIEKNVKRNYAPKSVLLSSFRIRNDIYIIPQITKLIEIEKELRLKFRVPFTEARITILREKIRNLVMEIWPFIVTDSYDGNYALDISCNAA